MNNDLEHLRLLSIFHYVLAGIMALVSCFPVIHLVLVIMILTGQIPVGDLSERPPHGPDPEQMMLWMGVFSMAVTAVLICLGWTLAFCLFLAAGRLKAHTHHTFCLVVAGFSFTFTPLGTALGVFTIIVLARPSVKELFDGAAADRFGEGGHGDFPQ